MIWRVINAAARALKGWLSARGVPAAAGTFSGQVIESEDDAFQRIVAGTMFRDDNEATIGRAYAGQGGDAIRTGFRFRSVTLEQGQDVTYAVLQFTSAVQRTDETLPVRIWGQKHANPSAFTHADFDITDRDLTTAFVDWTIPHWLADEVSENTTTPNLASIVKELVDDPSWATGNAMVFLIEWQPTYEGDYFRNPWSAFAFPQRAAKLLVDTVEEPPPPDEPGEPGEPVEGAYYMSPTGSNSNPGTKESPWKTLRHASTVLSPGDTLYLRGGVYNQGPWSNNAANTNVYESNVEFVGTQANPITIASFPGERAIFDGFGHPWHPRTFGDGNSAFAPIALRVVKSEWVSFEDFDVRGSVGRGFRLHGANNCTLRRVRCYKNHADGAYFHPGDLIDATNYVFEFGNGNTVEDSDFFDNFDVSTGGNSASGLKMPYNSGQTVRRCRFWNNGDDGLDFYGSRGPWLVEDCLSFNNGYPNVTGASGNGMGFKLSGRGSSPGNTLGNKQPSVIRRCISARNWKQGFMTNRGWPVTLEHVTAWMDGGDPSEWSGGTAINATHNTSLKPPQDDANSVYSSIGLVNAAGGGNNISSSGGTTLEGNSWQSGITHANVGFISTSASHPDFLALSEGSPCRAAGALGLDIGALQFGQRFPLDTSVLMSAIGGVDRVYET